MGNWESELKKLKQHFNDEIMKTQKKETDVQNQMKVNLEG
jgi:hypothetical protein